jgi:pimeloyl-ACP methyl ester carboxylesterase
MKDRCSLLPSINGEGACPMERATTDGLELDYEVHGTGEPVVLLHCGFVADSWKPLIERTNLGDRYQLIAYHRRGYGESARPTGPMSMEQQAGDCLAVMRYLGLERAHLAGHSFGGSIALEMARQEPSAVRSLLLLEAVLPGVPRDPADQKFFLETITAAVQLYGAGDRAAAVDLFLQGAFGPGYRAVIDAAIPGWFDRAVEDAGAAFQAELPSLQSWNFSRAAAAGIPAPVLSVYHDDPYWGGFREGHEVLCSWFPQAEGYVAPVSSHLLPIMNPSAVAVGLDAFLTRHTANHW